MLFKLMPALLKGLLGPVVPDAILHGHLPIILGSVLDSVLDSFFGPAGETICLYIGVFCVWGSGSDPFFGQFWHRVLPVFLGTLEPEHAPCRT